MVQGGSARSERSAGDRISRRLSRIGVALALIAATGIGFVGVASASVSGLPPVEVTYSGSMSIEAFPTTGEPADNKRTLSWTATANSGGSDGAQALDFSSVSGSGSTANTGNCYDNTTALSLASTKNPVAGGWFLNETSDYPEKGWQYIVTAAPSQIPVHVSYKGACNISSESDELVQTNEMLQTQETFSAAQQSEWEALFAEFHFSPGGPAARTRTFSFDGISKCTCYPGPTHVKQSMTLTVSVTSGAAGNNIKTNPAPGGGGGQSPKGTQPKRKRSESLRKALKEQADEDLGPALEADWKAHGLTAALGLNSGLAFSTVLKEVGEPGLLTDGDEATVRVINDYTIIEDPPDHHFRRLAKPHKPKRPTLHSCAAVASAERVLCASLREAEMAMLSSDARAKTISDALVVTINRDSSAIKARDYASAQRQYAHFESLHASLHRVLKTAAASGARVASVLRSMGVSGTISSSDSASAISAIEAKLTRAKVSVAKLTALAPGALQAGEADGLAALAVAAG